MKHSSYSQNLEKLRKNGDFEEIQGESGKISQNQGNFFLVYKNLFFPVRELFEFPEFPESCTCVKPQRIHLNFDTFV